MTTVNSLSGGKTSSYLATHYPADYELFALVCNDDKRCAHPDKKIMQLANDKLQKYSARFGEFIGTPENYLTINVILDLEQKLGREIIWLRDLSFDQLIAKKSGLPNQQKRWCTTEMKMKPIFEWCYLYTELPVKMRLGYRIDEMERMDRLTTAFELPISCSLQGAQRQKWLHDVEWRIGDFPLIKDRIEHYKIYLWSILSGLIFPDDSNCQMCFHKQIQQLRKNFDDAPEIMNWAKEKEAITKRRFKDEMKMKQIQKIGLQSEFVFGTGSGCNSGGCTD